jgi:formate-dependent nitrite reductase membrane component NrfD
VSDRLKAPYAQPEWRIRVALDFFFGGAGSSLAAFYLINIFATGTYDQLNLYVPFLSLLLVMCGLFLLASELGRRSNLLRSLTNMRTSWLARGSALNLALIAFLLLLIPRSAMTDAWATTSAISFGVIIVALMVSLYPGMLLHSVKDIKLWRSRFQPVLTLVSAILSGLGLLIIIDAAIGSSLVAPAAEALVGCGLVLIIQTTYFVSLRRSKYLSARCSYTSLISSGGGLGLILLFGFGGILPLASLLVFLAVPMWQDVRVVSYFGALSLLAGCIAYRLQILRAARHEPITALNY